jgi:hypothetical protein
MDYHEELLSLMGDISEKKKVSSPKRPFVENVPFNMRVNETLKNDFDDLCRDNHTNMSREIKRFMRLAVEAQKL